MQGFTSQMLIEMAIFSGIGREGSDLFSFGSSLAFRIDSY